MIQYLHSKNLDWARDTGTRWFLPRVKKTDESTLFSLPSFGSPLNGPSPGQEPPRYWSDSTGNNKKVHCWLRNPPYMYWLFQLTFLPCDTLITWLKKYLLPLFIWRTTKLPLGRTFEGLLDVVFIENCSFTNVWIQVGHCLHNLFIYIHPILTQKLNQA